MKYGATADDWICKNCGADWHGAGIPDDQRAIFYNATHFSRRLAVYDHFQDRTIAWRCPDCRHEVVR